MPQQKARLSRSQARRLANAAIHSEARDFARTARGNGARGYGFDPRNYWRQLLPARISSATSINGGVRYEYTVAIGHWNMSGGGPGTWVSDVAGPFTAYSEFEDMNTFTSGTGAIGTGNTNVAQSDGTVNGGPCKMVPLPSGGYVHVVLRGLDSSGAPYFTIIGAPNSAQ